MDSAKHLAAALGMLDQALEKQTTRMLAEKPPITAVVHAYRRAQNDPKMVLPSYLMAALEMLASDFEEERANAYANAAITKAKVEPRWESDPDLDRAPGMTR